MRKTEDLTRAEHLEIGILLDKGYSLRLIVKELGRSPNTVSYEPRRTMFERNAIP